MSAGKEVILAHLNRLGVHYASPVSFLQCRNGKGVRLPFDVMLVVGGRTGLVSTMEIPDEGDHEHAEECRDNNYSRNRYARSVSMPILYLRRRDRSVYEHLERFVRYLGGSVVAHAVMVDHLDAARNVYGDGTEAVMITDRGEIVVDVSPSTCIPPPPTCIPPPPTPPQPSGHSRHDHHTPPSPLPATPTAEESTTVTKTRTKTTTETPNPDKSGGGESALVQVAEVVLERAVEILIDKAVGGDGVVRKTIADKPAPNGASSWLASWLSGSTASSTPSASHHSGHHHLKGSG
jgi:hypothetical protein